MREEFDMITIWLRIGSLALLWACCTAAGAGGGPLGMDHILALDESGIWSRHNQTLVQDLSALSVLGGALWEGNDTRLGKTFWKATDSMLLANASAAVAKRVFRRARPINGNDPNDWFGPSTHQSFPSGEVTHIAAVVTPFIAEYAKDQPAIWGLAALPAYVGIARMKSQAHWQTEVLAGAALGAGIGYYAQQRENAWTATVLPRGLTVGFRHSF